MISVSEKSNKKSAMESVIFRVNIENKVAVLLMGIDNGDSKKDSLVVAYWPDGSNMKKRVYTRFSYVQICDLIAGFNYEHDTIEIAIEFDTYKDGDGNDREKICLRLGTK